MIARTLCLLLAAAAAGCAVTESPAPPPDIPSTRVAAFSVNAAGADLPTVRVIRDQIAAHVQELLAGLPNRAVIR